MPREFAFSLIFFATRTELLRKQGDSGVESLPRVGIPIYQAKFTTLFLDAVAHLVITAHLGILYEVKMKVEKLRKTCGNVLFIKSIISLVSTILLIFGGIFLSIVGRNLIDNNQNAHGDFEGAVGACSKSFIGALGIVFGIVAIVVGCLCAVYTILCFIHSRRILRNDVNIIKSIITCIVIEILSTIVGLGLFVIGIMKIKETVGIYLLIASTLLIIQSVVTIVLLFKLKKLNSAN